MEVQIPKMVYHTHIDYFYQHTLVKELAGKRAITLRDNAGGEYHKSILFNWGKGIDIENLASGEDCYQRFINDEIKFSENIFDQCTNQGVNAEAQVYLK